MTNHRTPARRHLAGAALLASTLAVVGWAGAAAAADGLEVYKKANCVGCHKWHGGGGGGYGGAALSLRETYLGHAEIVEVIRCGRPSTRMPYHDRRAYRKGAPCYGIESVSTLGGEAPPKAASMLRDEEIEAVTQYVLTVLKGAGEPGFEECIAYWGAGARQCDRMQ